jgi:hypothetical protein
MLYPNILALIKWTVGVTMPLHDGAAEFDSFSQSYTAVALYFICLAVCMKRDLSIFMILTSYGAIAIISILVFIISVGFYSIGNTKFRAVVMPEDRTLDLEYGYRQIYLFNSNFTPLAGVLGIGYFLHPVSIPIMRNNKN